MKSTLSTFTNKTIEYPCLRQTEMGTVVLLTDEKTGTVVCPGAGSSHSIGHTASDWAPDLLHSFDGQLILEN